MPTVKITHPTVGEIILRRDFLLLLDSLHSHWIYRDLRPMSSGVFRRLSISMTESDFDPLKREQRAIRNLQTALSEYYEILCVKDSRIHLLVTDIVRS